jgi:hypothetical protein
VRACCHIAVLPSGRFLPLAQVPHQRGEVPQTAQAQRGQAVMHLVLPSKGLIRSHRML